MNNSVIGSTSGEPEVRLSGGQSVSMQVLQQLYKDVTGKTEKLGKQFYVHHRTNFQDLENLNHSIVHVLEQYHVIESNCNVTFFHIDDSHERFSSFDRARTMEMASASAIENVRVEYEFLIVLPQIGKPQSYKVAIEVHSRTAVQARKTRGGFNARLIMAALGRSTGNVSIEYVDYAVAKNLLSTVNGWFEGLESEEDSRFLSVAKNYSHHFDWIAKYSTAAIAALVFHRAYHQSGITSVEQALISGLVAFSVIFIASGFAEQFGRLLESTVDQYEPCSYLKLNRGDDALIRLLGKSRIKSFVMAVVSLVGAVGVNILAAIIASKVGGSA